MCDGLVVAGHDHRCVCVCGVGHGVGVDVLELGCVVVCAPVVDAGPVQSVGVYYSVWVIARVSRGGYDKLPGLFNDFCDAALPSSCLALHHHDGQVNFTRRWSCCRAEWCHAVARGLTMRLRLRAQRSAQLAGAAGPLAGSEVHAAHGSDTVKRSRHL